MNESGFQNPYLSYSTFLLVSSVCLSLSPTSPVRFPAERSPEKCSALRFPPLYSNEKTCLLWWLVVLLSSCPKAAHSRDLSEAAPKSNNNPKKKPKLLGGSTILYILHNFIIKKLYIFKN